LRSSTWTQGASQPQRYGPTPNMTALSGPHSAPRGACRPERASPVVPHDRFGRGAVALGDVSPVPAPELRKYFDETLDPNCQCWHETPQAQPHIGATSWVVFSMSKLGIKALPGVLSALLDLQSPEGWWSLYLPPRPDPINAGTYPTAWATQALCSQLPLQTTEPAVSIDKMNFAIENALNWLSKNEIVQAARWNDYPANSPFIKSASISGLIVHVMDACGYTEGATALHRHWLSSLPFEITSASTTEMSNTNTFLKDNGLGLDRTRHYVLPWVLIATVDAYASGTFLQRAAAMQWIERILRPALLNPEVRSQNWVEAELLYALKYL
jgi:hypothetical protein